MRNYISGKSAAKADDGDHGLGPSGLVKRKGARDLSQKLVHIVLDSPRKKLKKDMIATIKNAGLEDFVDANLREKYSLNKSVDLGARKPASEILASEGSYLPNTGFKKIVLPKLRDRNRKMMAYNINTVDEKVNRSLRRYVN